MFSPGSHPGRTRTGVVHRPVDIRQLSKIPLERAGGFTVQRCTTTVCGDTPSARPGPRSFAGLRPKQKRPSRGSPQKACFLNECRALRRVVPLGVIERAAVTATGPRLRPGPAHTRGDALAAGPVKQGPRDRCARRIERPESQLKNLAEQCTSVGANCQ